MKKINRRNFLKKAFQAVVGLAVFSTFNKLPKEGGIPHMHNSKKARYYKKLAG